MIKEREITIYSGKLMTVFAVLLFALSASIHAADWQNIRINELMAEGGDYADWIEIYNPGDQPVLLEGLYLTDDLANLRKWEIPYDLVIQPKGFEVFWADGMDSGRHTNFKLKQKGEEVGLSDPEGNLIDSVVYGGQIPDVSLGRQPDGSSDWLFFGEPGPGDENNRKGCPENMPESLLPHPQFSLKGGFYNGSQTVLLSSNLSGTEIRYTLDSSKPSSSSTLYTNPIVINSTTVVRARVFDKGCFPGQIITHTYFINETCTLPVVSIAVDPPDLWDDDKGIYTEGANYDPFEGIANYLEDWERPISLELYETGGKPGFNINAGMKIHGGSGRDYLQKSVSIHARERFGTDEIAYKLFPDETVNRFKSFILRNDGCCDDLRTMFRDAILHLVVKDRMDIDLQAYRPSIVFLNGEYWGILNIREKLNEDYLASHHEADPDNVDILKDHSSVAEGDAEHYKNILNYIESNDMTSVSSYEYLKTQIDTDEYINYQIAEIYGANTDWPDNNMKYWRPKTPGGRWRWFLYDTDFAFVHYEYHAIKNAYDGQPLFRKLLENPEFKNEFIQRFASHMNTTFKPERVIRCIANLRENIETEIPGHMEKWGGQSGSHSISSISDWENNIEIKKTFANQRLFYARQNIAEQFGLSGTAKLTINISEPGTGRILVNHVAMPDNGLTGTWFKDIPLQIEAVPNAGYQFAKWEHMATPHRNSEPASVASIILTEDSEVTAVFQRDVIPGDINNDGDINLFDAITVLQICSGITPSLTVFKSDINGDEKIGIEEAVYIIQKVSQNALRGF